MHCHTANGLVLFESRDETWPGAPLVENLVPGKVLIDYLDIRCLMALLR